MKVAFISGTSIARSILFDAWQEETIRTPYGPVVVRREGDLVVLNRHGFAQTAPPHAINYRGNVAALKALGVSEAVSLNSVGSLREELPPGTVVSCSDYVSFAPATFHDESLCSLAPEIANRLVPGIIEGLALPVHTGRVYVQTRGPRFETKAEVRILRSWGDVVGMTMANEADLCQELGIGYNSFCMIDNYANGLTDHRLSHEEFSRLVLANRARVDALVTHILGRLRG
jgi:5'-methylthioadenosine phosphorylase